MLLSLDERLVGHGAPALLVADIGAQHAGDLARALAMIDAAAAAGAGAVQIHPALEGRRGRVALRSEWYAHLRDRARRHGLVLFAVASSAERAALFAALGLPALVVDASALQASEMLHALGGFGRPIVLATGGADPALLGGALGAIARGAGAPSRRPPTILLTPDVGTMAALADRFGGVVGWQDARAGHVLAVGAVALGARVIVKTFADPGLGTEGFRSMVTAVRELEASLGATVSPTRRRASAVGFVGSAEAAEAGPRPRLGSGRAGR